LRKKKNFNIVEDEELLSLCIETKKDYPAKCQETKKIDIQINCLLKKIKDKQ
jgi:hypothetical protein